MTLVESSRFLIQFICKLDQPVPICVDELYSGKMPSVLRLASLPFGEFLVVECLLHDGSTTMPCARNGGKVKRCGDDLATVPAGYGFVSVHDSRTATQ